MKKNVFILILLGVFLGLFGMNILNNFNDTKEEDKLELLPWNLYYDNLYKISAIIDSNKFETSDLSIFKTDQVDVTSLTLPEQIRMIYSYTKYKDSLDSYEDEYLTYEDYDIYSYQLFGDIITKPDSIYVGNDTYFVNNPSKERFDVVKKESNYDYSAYAYLNNVKSSYKKGNIIYFDVELFFEKSTTLKNTTKIERATDPSFYNIYCIDKECYASTKTSSYRITLEINKNNDGYKLLNVKKLGED